MPGAVGGEIGDEIDAVTNAETKAAAFEAAGIERRMLVEVQDALHRLDDGTYGTCVDCGRQIEENRRRMQRPGRLTAGADQGKTRLNGCCCQRPSP